MLRNKFSSAGLAALVAQLGISSAALAGVDSLLIGNDNTTISFLMYYSGPSAPKSRQLYIDADRSTATGFAGNGIGSDYWISDGSMYRFSGEVQSTFAWKLIGPVSFADDGSKAQWTVPRSYLGSTTAIHIVGTVKGADGESRYPKKDYEFSTITPVLERDPYIWPFAQDSIWNMPIGRGATYVAANLPAIPGNGSASNGLQADREKIVLRPTAPSTSIFYSPAGWKADQNRCTPTEVELTTVPIPSDYTVSHNNTNSSATFLLADGRTIVQSQPFARCTANGHATSQALIPPVDLYGPGIEGAHGGSRLSAIGGTLRLGELRRGGEPPRHALKLNVYAAQVLFKCTDTTTRSDCYRWPALAADRYAVGNYGTVNNGVVHNGAAISGGTPAMRMGALLAIPASQDLAALGLVTEPAKQLAWTLQNYGAYIVDDTWGPGYALNVEDGVDGSFTAHFAADWAFEFEAAGDSKSPWAKDIQRLMTALYVVDSNSRTTVGGGGEPLQPLAPPLPTLLPKR